MSLVDAATVATAQVIATVASFLKGCYDFVNNKEAIQQLYQLGIDIADAREAYVANKKDCIALADAVALIESSLLQLQRKEKGSNHTHPPAINTALTQLVSALGEARALITSQVLPPRLSWVKQKVWIAQKVADRQKIKGQITSCATTISQQMQVLGFTLQIDIYTTVKSADGSAEADLKEFVERQNQHLDGEVEGLLATLQDDTRKQAQQLKADIDEMLSRHLAPILQHQIHTQSQMQASQHTAAGTAATTSSATSSSFSHSPTSAPGGAVTVFAPATVVLPTAISNRFDAPLIPPAALKRE